MNYSLAALLLLNLVLCSEDAVPIYETQKEPVETLPHIELLYVYDISSHGSTFPETNVTGLEHEADLKKIGKLTEFGERQMYLRGKEMHRRLVDHKRFMKPFYNHDEMTVLSLNHHSSIKST